MLGQTKSKLFDASPYRQHLRYSKCVETRVAAIISQTRSRNNPGVTVAVVPVREGHLALTDSTVPRRPSGHAADTRRLPITTAPAPSTTTAMTTKPHSETVGSSRSRES